MVELPQTYRTSRWIVGVVVAFIGISVTGLVHFSQTGEIVEALGFGAFLFLGAMALVECATNRVVLTKSTLEVREWFKTRTLLPSQITRVVAEKGAPVALELREGGWFKMPKLGTGPHPNSLRAWVKRYGTSVDT